jgi:hypothetical protein
MSHFTCAALSPQELAYYLRETFHSNDFPYDVDHFTGTTEKRFHPRLLDAAKIPSGEWTQIGDTRSGSTNIPCDLDYFIAYIVAHPTYRTFAKHSGVKANALLILGTKQVLDVHGSPFYPLACYIKEKGNRPPALYAVRDLNKLNPDAHCLLLYREP